MNTTCIGDEAMARKGVLKLYEPVERGMVTNWDNMELIWDHMFRDELQTDPKEHAVMASEPPMNPKCNREKMTQILFETYSSPAFYMNLHNVLSLYASGQTSGVVVCCGDAVTSTAAIFEGYALSHSMQRADIGGRDLTNHLMGMLNSRGYDMPSYRFYEVRHIKETLCYVAKNYEDLHAPAKSTNYELPDGQVISIDEERAQCAELLFNSSCGIEITGIQGMINKCIREKNDMSMYGTLYGNIVLSGGCTLLPGFATRLESEIGNSCTVRAPPMRKYSVWIGGSILASLSTFKDMWITKKEYDEVGPAIVHRKCTV